MSHNIGLGPDIEFTLQKKTSKFSFGSEPLNVSGSLPDICSQVTWVLVNRLRKTLDSFVQIPDQVYFSEFGFMVGFGFGWIWVWALAWGLDWDQCQSQGFGQGHHLQKLSQTPWVHLQYGTREQEHEVESIAIGCCTNDRIGYFGPEVSFMHILPELWELP